MAIFCFITYICVYIFYQILLISIFFSRSGKKNPPISFPRLLMHSSHVGLAFSSGIIPVGHCLQWLSCLSGWSCFCMSFRVGHGLSIKFRGLKDLSIPTHFSLLLGMLCSWWHLNYEVWKLVSDVFLNRIISQNPSFSSCKHMSPLTPLKPCQIQCAR